MSGPLDGSGSSNAFGSLGLQSFDRVERVERDPGLRDRPGSASARAKSPSIKLPGSSQSPRPEPRSPAKGSPAGVSPATRDLALLSAALQGPNAGGQSGGGAFFTSSPANTPGIPSAGNASFSRDATRMLAHGVLLKPKTPQMASAFSNSNSASAGSLNGRDQFTLDPAGSGGEPEDRSSSALAVPDLGEKRASVVSQAMSEGLATTAESDPGSQNQRARGRRRSSLNSKAPPLYQLDQMGDPELARLETLFNLQDVEGKGSVGVDKLMLLLEAIGYPMPADHASELLHQVDTNKNGLLEFTEFVQLVKIFKNTAQFRLYEKKAAVSATESRMTRVLDIFRMILPDIYWRWAWDVMLLFIAVYIVFSVSWLDMLRTENEWQEAWWYFLPADLFVTAVLLAEMVMRGHISFYDGQRMTEDRGAIMQRYLKSWFVVDLLALLPLRLLSRDYTISTVLAHFRCLRWLRNGELFASSGGRVGMTRAYINFHFSFVPLVQNLSYFATFTHVLAAVWYWNTSTPVSYSGSIYVVMYHLSGAGFGDISPDSTAQRWFSCFLCLSAMIVNGLVIGGIVSFLSTADVEDMRRTSLVELMAILEFFEVPVALQEEVLQFQNHILKKDVQGAFGFLIDTLPREIKLTLSVQIKLQLLDEVPVFKRSHETVQITLAQMLDTLVFCPEEYLALAGEKAEEMFFINYGFVDVLSAAGVYQRTLLAGGNFGFGVLLVPDDLDAIHIESAKSLTYVEVLVLTKHRFDHVLTEYPRFRKEFFETVTAFGRSTPHRTPPESPHDDAAALAGGLGDEVAPFAESQILPRMASNADSELRGAEENPKASQDSNEASWPPPARSDANAEAVPHAVLPAESGDAFSNESSNNPLGGAAEIKRPTSSDGDEVRQVVSAGDSLRGEDAASEAVASPGRSPPVATVAHVTSSELPPRPPLPPPPAARLSQNAPPPMTPPQLVVGNATPKERRTTGIMTTTATATATTTLASNFLSVDTTPRSKKTSIVQIGSYPELFSSHTVASVAPSAGATAEPAQIALNQSSALSRKVDESGTDAMRRVADCDDVDQLLDWFGEEMEALTELNRQAETILQHLSASGADALRRDMSMPPLSLPQSQPIPALIITRRFSSGVS